MHNGKNIKILFGVPAGDYYSKQFASVAAAMPEADCLFLAFSWSTGIDLRKSQFQFAHIPWRNPGINVQSEELPPVAEFTVRGFSQSSIPLIAKKAYSALSYFIESEIIRFAPDIVVYGPIDHSICYLMDEIAKKRSIPRAGILASFISDHFILQSQGVGWIDYLRNVELFDNKTCEISLSNSYIQSLKFRSVTTTKSVFKKQFWIRGLERLLRVLGGGLTFDTFKSLSSLVVSKIAPAKWFPNLKTLDSSNDIHIGCVLIALNQPALTSWDNSIWIELITLALESTPDDTSIVIRPHPSETARELPKQLEKRLRSRRNLFISRAGHGPSLTTIIQQCTAVMTVNSAVGMEALLEGAVVLTVGPAFYARPGMAIAVTPNDVALVRNILTDSEQFRPIPTEVFRFTKWLIDECIVSSPLVNSKIGNKLVDRIRSLANQGNVKV